jgi:Glycyl-tRNA synthetase (class II)
MTKVKMDNIVSLCKRRGVIFQSSSIYGGGGEQTLPVADFEPDFIIHQLSDLIPLFVQ